MRTLKFEISPEYAGMKIEHYLRREKGISRKVIISLKQLPHDQGILLNGQHARTVDLINGGDVVELRLPDPPPAKGRPSDIAVNLLYEDEDVLVFDKPSDMPCHPSGGHFRDTLAHVYAAYCERCGGGGSFRPLNRLDKDTTGAVVVARNQLSAGVLWKQVQKEYVALVQGDLPEDNAIIDLPIMPEHPYAIRRIVDPDGQTATTEYRVIKRFGSHTLASFTLHTGRTHQIRVHMSYIGHPLSGDDFYGGRLDIISRQALHCRSVSFHHPITQKFLNINSPMPEDIMTALRGLEGETIV